MTKLTSWEKLVSPSVERLNFRYDYRLNALVDETARVFIDLGCKRHVKYTGGKKYGLVIGDYYSLIMPLVP